MRSAANALEAASVAALIINRRRQNTARAVKAFSRFIIEDPTDTAGKVSGLGSADKLAQPHNSPFRGQTDRAPILCSLVSEIWHI
jgi:hypothetical protein